MTRVELFLRKSHDYRIIGNLLFPGLPFTRGYSRQLLVKAAWGREAPPQARKSDTSPPTSGKIVAIEVHDLGPRSREVLHERFLRVVRRIDFRECPELRVRTEEEIDAR